MADLTEYGKRYKGKKVSRQNIQDYASDQEEDEMDEDNEEEETDEEADGTDEEDGDEDDEEDEEDDEEEEDDVDEDNKLQKKNYKIGEDADDDLKLFSSDRSEEIEKGKVVRSQLRKEKNRN